jgi:hypothetical protein
MIQLFLIEFIIIKKLFKIKQFMCDNYKIKYFATRDFDQNRFIKDKIDI